ncbi:ATP-binding protein [Pseudonocardia charpentierae]|uniref:Histidine kinase n=1 Tax=Pseudonocardia charpentierae TaxID=3075545 RepID=A0ABU2N8V8_9PSEU|nr:ATP-binding protein [Pseudonocardia sp. DSM 45834]MDT0350373.1 histidine kinase [Pseudonocardia sp. DSM 45834]
MTGTVSSVVRTVPGTRAAARDGLAARVAVVVLLVLCSAVSLGWLAVGAVTAAAQYSPAVARSVGAAAAAGSSWARAVAAAAPASEPLSQAVLDYGFSAVNLVLAGVLLGAGLRGRAMRTWPIRLLAVALVGSAGAFNLQAHAAARAIETATGLALSGVHQVVLHGVACAAYIVALLVFPTPSWDGLPGARHARGGLAVVGVVTFLLVGLGTAVLPHTTSCVLFFGFLVPAVGLVVLPRRVRRGPGAEARTQARLLFSTLVGGFAVAVVLGVVTLLLGLLGEAPGLTLVDPTAHAQMDHGAASTAPIALLFWFSRLASAAIAVVVLVATRHDRLWTAERWFSRGLVVLLVMAVGGGAFVVLRTVTVGVLGVGGATALATVLVALVFGPLYVRGERVVDRLLYGTRPAPYRVLADVTAFTRSTLPSTAAAAPDLTRVAEAVAHGLGANVCLLTVRRPGLRDRTYEWTDPTAGFGTWDLVEVPVRHGAEQVGVLAVDRQAAAGLYAHRSHLLTDVADGLGVVLEASRSGIELERQLRAALAHAEEIAASRRRTVAEMDAERRRIERDLHDGAQHHLVSLRLTLGLVEHQVAGGELDQAREWLAKLVGQLADVEAVLAATADGVSSLVLAEKGLVETLRSELGATHPPVGFDDGGITSGRRFPADVEAAVWFCCAEAVGNARKHAQGAPISVGLAERRGALTFTVRDEGPGFVVDATDPGGGRGMRNMTTRLSGVGGHVVVRSVPGEGTAVTGTVPLPAESAAAAAPPPAAPPREPAPPMDSAPTGARASHPDPPTDPILVVEPMSEPVRAVDEPTSLGGQVRELLRWARAAYRDSPAEGRLDDLTHRLGEPLRIAVLATVDDARHMLVEALIGTPDVPRPVDGVAGPVRYAFGDRGVESGPDAVVVTLPAPSLRAMTLIDTPDPALLDGPADAPVADALVLLLHYGRPADLTLLDQLHAAGHRGAIAVLAVADQTGAAAEQAVREFGDDPAVRRVCHAVVPVAPATAVAAARLGDDEHEWLEQWVARAPEPSGTERSAGDGAVPSSTVTEVPVAAADDGSEIATALLDRLGPLGARRALKLVRGGEGDTRAALAGALVRHSGLGELQELIGSRFLSRADALRSRTVLAGLDALIRTTPPESDAHRLSYQLERVRAGAHELREIELLDLLRCGGLNLPDEQRSAAERLLGADGDGVRDRLALAADATAEQVREAAALQVARWRQIADHPVASTRVRDAAHDLVRTCERLSAGTEVAAPR